MSDNENENNQQNNQKQAKTPADLKKQIASKMKQAKLKIVEAKVKELMEKIASAEKVLKGLNAELEEVFIENSDVFGN